jgi:hypothetical protein
VYTYPNAYVHAWSFGTDGNLTVPGDIHANTNLILQATSGIPSGVVPESLSSQGGWSGSYINTSTTGGSGTGLTVNAVSNAENGYIDSVTIVNPGTGYTDGDTIVITNEFDNIAAFYITVPKPNWTFGTDGGLTFPDSTVQTTAYPGVTTVAKDGPTLPTTTGTADSLTHDFVGSTLTDGTYGPFTRDVVTFSILVSSGTISSFVNLSSTGDVIVGGVVGTIDSGDLGGTPGLHTITITVISVVQATPTALDLTKTVNKLADGVYSLADGVEGQIMYLVKQTGTIFDQVTVIVANARVSGVLRTDHEHYPFSYATNNVDIDTLIFTDGAWQAVGGGWD